MTRPVTAPFISIMVLSAVVVPWTIRSVARSSSRAVVPSEWASEAMPSITPTDWSSSVVGDLRSATPSPPRASTKSVKVPPTSMPIR